MQHVQQGRKKKRLENISLIWPLLPTITDHHRKMRFSFFWDVMQRRLIVDVSEQPISPIVKDHDCLNLKEFIDRSPRNIYKELPRYACVTSQKSKDLIT